MAVMNGIDLLTSGKILGHTNYQTTERYAHLADETIRRATDRVSGLMAGAIAIPRHEHLRQSRNNMEQRHLRIVS